ncbi:MAG: hypothetical protein ACYSUT_10885 [Planctomycetota bacterium]|jgi:hypothetical protein
MTNQNAQLLEILKIGHDVSIRGEGISFRDALARTQYKKKRRYLTPQNLIPIIKDHPDIIDEWIMYSCGKRTSGGWYVLEEGKVGRVGNPLSIKHFDSLEEAVAAYVVLELDYWAKVCNRK